MTSRHSLRGHVTVLLVTCLVGVAHAQGREKRDDQKAWNYDDDSKQFGPSTWSHRFPECAEPYQSPIDFDTNSSAVTYSPMKPLSIKYQERATRNAHFKMVNNGYGVSLKPAISSTTNIFIHNGGLPGMFVLHNIHFHWSQRDWAGSEHTINGKQYPLEMHVVTRNTKYTTIKQALGQHDGVAVIGVLFDIGAKSNPMLSWVPNLMKVQQTDQKYLVTINLDEFFPLLSKNYFRYNGSLTTPPCSRNVIWSVMTKPVEISKLQLNQFRNIKFSMTPRQKTMGNYRSTNPINNRQIFTNMVT